MEAAKFGSAVSLAFVLVLCITSTSVTWHCLNEVARLQSRVERLEAEGKGSSISEVLGQLGVQTPVYQGDNGEEEIPRHQRKVRQFGIDELIAQIVRTQLEAHLNCSTDEETKCTIEPGPKGDPGPPGPQGETGPQGQKGERGEEGKQGYPGFPGQKGEEGEQGLQGPRGERGEKGDMGTRGPVGERGQKGDTGPSGPKGNEGEKGRIGYPGFKGQKGEVGDLGERGPIGERGEKGDIGPQGPSGGEKGERGDTGPAGSKGVRGEKGHLGYPGYKGNKGDTGVQGETGSAGEKGDRGDVGPQGPTGERGPTGLTGPVGPKGEKGQLGHTGYKGQKGEIGEKGQVGERGEKGDQGVMGEMGIQGAPGQMGQKGEKGDMGAPGSVGEKGERGDTGLTGRRGERDQGMSVVPGRKGEKGDTPAVGPYTCGGTIGWDRVAYLDMTNSSHQCPGDMEKTTLSGKRVCGRNALAQQSCVSAKFPTSGLQYSHVCGRIRGYQYGRTLAFYSYTFGHVQSIDSWYVDGVSVTHGPPGSREHVWTFATGYNEEYTGSYVCPCAPNASDSIRVPPFVGQDYFCESGATTGIPATQLYHDDPLWDGDGCIVTGNTCCQFNNPPYFTKQLNSTTTDALEVRACGYVSRGWFQGDTLVDVIELYIKP